jgi:methylenetetrahydrofolate reductase (NADPH)
MKIIQKIQKCLDEDATFFSFEYFPPKTDDGVANLYHRLDRMAQMGPLFIDVTWGAGGSTSQRTLEICKNAQKYIGLETMMHLTCTNMELSMIEEAILQAKEGGIQNILALRGGRLRFLRFCKQGKGKRELTNMDPNPQILPEEKNGRRSRVDSGMPRIW